MLPTIQSQIDRQYYFCYGNGKITTSTQNSTIVYIIRGDSFADYVQTGYGQSVSIDAQTLKRGINMQTCSIFSSPWVSNYGQPFAMSAFSNSAESINADFSCLNPSALQSNQGVVQSISGRKMTIKSTSGATLQLNMGACSRIEAPTDVPQVGQNAVFKGVPSGAGGFNVYALTCW